MKKEDKLYYIQTGWVGNAILWWGKGGQGYTTEIDKAGQYIYSQVKEIIQRPDDQAWECDHVDNCIGARKLIIDGQYLNPKKCLKGRRR